MEGGEGQMNRVSEKEKEEEWQNHGNCVYVYMRDRQIKQFNIKRGNDREKGSGDV